MAEEQYLEYLLIKRLPATCIHNTPRNARRIFTSDFRRMRKTRRYRLFLALAAILVCNVFVDRSCWMVERSNVWFEMVERAFTDKEWYDNFRLSKETFEYIVSEIENEITRKDTRMRKAIPSRKRVAIALYYLGSTAEYRTIANLFGISPSFVCLCIKEVSKAITRKLKTGFLCVPRGQDLREVMGLYKDKWGFPACAGAIDGTHIPIQTPVENHTDYVNRKSYHSILMQAVVDARYLFRDVVIGWPGSVHDARVLSNSELYNLGLQGKLFDPSITERVLGVDLNPVILGDPAYPLLNWLVKGYPENQNTPSWQCNFNYRLSRARMTVENTFGRWKGRFRRFLKRVDMTVSSATYLVAASCILHNICELRRDDFLENWLDEVQASVHQPDNITLTGENDEAESDAASIRDVLAQFFLTAEGRYIGYGRE